jgi:deoxyribodipyrimidine photolyase-like uncharacterized protein
MDTEGKRKRGRPKTKWRRTIENEIKKRGYTWSTIERKASNREEWRKLVLVLCAMRHRKDNNREEWRKLVLVLCAMRHRKDNNREEWRKLVLVLCAMRYSKDNNREEWRKLVLVLCAMRHSKDNNREEWRKLVLVLCLLQLSNRIHVVHSPTIRCTLLLYITSCLSSCRAAKTVHLL